MKLYHQDLTVKFVFILFSYFGFLFLFSLPVRQ